MQSSTQSPESTVVTVTGKQSSHEGRGAGSEAQAKSGT